MTAPTSSSPWSVVSSPRCSERRGRRSFPKSPNKILKELERHGLIAVRDTGIGITGVDMLAAKAGQRPDRVNQP